MEKLSRYYRIFIVSLKKQNNKNNLEAINKSLEKEEELNNEGKITKDYKKRIDRALTELTSNGDKYLTPGEEGLDKLSPKFKLLLENVNKSPGLVFIYSNFRSLEGKLFSKILDFNGYSAYGTSDNDKNPKYAIYSGDEDEKVKEILEVFTSEEKKQVN